MWQGREAQATQQKVSLGFKKYFTMKVRSFTSFTVRALDALEEIVDIADKITYAYLETPPQEYVVDGDLLRELSAALNKFYAIEQQLVHND